MKEQLITELIKFIIGILGIVTTTLLAVITSKVNAEKKVIVTKVGTENYNRALSIAKGLYYVLEDTFKTIAKSGEQKKDEMDKRLLNVIPELTQEELDSINKEIWNLFNKGVVEPIVTPVDTTKDTLPNGFIINATKADVQPIQQTQPVETITQPTEQK